MDEDINAETGITENWTYTPTGHRLLKGHCNQNDYTNKNQCVAMSAVAIVALFVFGNPLNWNRVFVDRILYEGDRYYGEVIESIGQSNEHFLEFDELLEQAVIFGQNITLEINSVYRFGSVTRSVDGFPDLLGALVDFKDSPFVGVIIVDGCFGRVGKTYCQTEPGFARAVLKWGEGNQRRYYLFDSHDAILLTGQPMERLKEAAIVETDSITELHRMLFDRIANSHDQIEQVKYNMATVGVLVQPLENGHPQANELQQTNELPQANDQPQVQNVNEQPPTEINPIMAILLLDNPNCPPVLSYYDAQKKETMHYLLVAQKSENYEIVWTNWENVEFTPEARNIIEQVEFLSANEQQQQQPDQLIDDSTQQPSTVSSRISRTIPHSIGCVTRSQAREQQELSTNADEDAEERPRDTNKQE